MKISDLKAIVIGIVTSDGSRHEFEIQLVAKTTHKSQENSEKENSKKESLNGNSPNRKYLTVREVAERLRLNPFTIYKWAANGRLPRIQLSNRALRFLESDIAKYEKLHTAGRIGDCLKDKL